MKKIITVHLKKHGYNILISQCIDDFFSTLKNQIKTKNIFIITDRNVEKLYLKHLSSLLTQRGYNVKTSIIPSGETGKSIKNLSYLYSKALESGVDRKSCAIALGGGVIGDIAGFFASTYMRGIDFIQVPTTLLAMADSSVGGKTAINIATGKNIAGTFYQPKFVWINTIFLESLSERQLRNGLAEVIKYAFIFDKKFYRYLLKLFDNKIISSYDFNYIVYKSCLYKAKVVEKDEKDTTGLRAVLNFGHTYAHALETATKYTKFLHGEAIAIGILFAARLSLELKVCSIGTYRKVEELLKLAAFNIINNNTPSLFLSLMKKDKKSVDRNISFVLIKDISKTVNKQVNDKLVLKILKKFRST